MVLISYISFFLWLLPNGVFHDIHLSNTMLHYKSEEEAIHLTLKIFADDLESAIKAEFGEEIKIFSGKELPHTDSLVYSYILQHLEITIDGKLAESVFIGKEISEDLASVWCYIEFPKLKNLESFKLRNNILMELYDDQRNMIMIKKDNVRKSHYSFTKDDNQTFVYL